MSWNCFSRILMSHYIAVNTLRPRQDGRRFPDDIFKSIFLNENVWISIKISLKFVPKGSISNIPSLVQIMAWRQPGDKPISELMMVSVLTHICVTRPQWVNTERGVIYCEIISAILKNVVRLTKTYSEPLIDKDNLKKTCVMVYSELCWWPGIIHAVNTTAGRAVWVFVSGGL